MITAGYLHCENACGKNPNVSSFSMTALVLMAQENKGAFEIVSLPEFSLLEVLCPSLVGVWPSIAGPLFL